MSPTTGLYLSGSLLKSDSGFAVPTKLQSVRKSDRERLRIQAVFSFPPAFLTRNGRAEKLKQDLLEAIEPLERGATASPDDQLRIDQVPFTFLLHIVGAIRNLESEALSFVCVGETVGA